VGKDQTQDSEARLIKYWTQYGRQNYERKSIMYYYVVSYRKKEHSLTIISSSKGDNSGNSHTRVMNVVIQHVCNDRKYTFEVSSRYLKQ
jgi:hypothetical protein